MLALAEIPEIPYSGCTSRKGCQCDIRRHWESRYSDDDDEFSTGVRFSIDYSDIFELENLQDLIVEKIDQVIQEEMTIRLYPHKKLKQLKMMLDDELITEEEYNHTKARILSAM